MSGQVRFPVLPDGWVVCLVVVTADGSRLGLAGVNVHLVLTVSTVHCTAPMELALTLGGAADP